MRVISIGLWSIRGCECGSQGYIGFYAKTDKGEIIRFCHECWKDKIEITIKKGVKNG